MLETSRSGDVDLAERVRALRDGRATGDVRARTARCGDARSRVDRADDGTPLDAEQLDDVVARLLLAGYSDRLARRRDRARTDDRGRSQAVFHLRSGGEVAVAADDDLARSRWMVVADLDAGAPGRAGSAPPGRGARRDRVVTELVDPLVLVDDVVDWDRRRRRRRRRTTTSPGRDHPVERAAARRPTPRRCGAALVAGDPDPGPGSAPPTRPGRRPAPPGRAGCAPTRPDDGLAGLVRRGAARTTSTTGSSRSSVGPAGPRTWVVSTCGRHCSARLDWARSGGRSTSSHRPTGPPPRAGASHCATARSTASPPPWSPPSALRDVIGTDVQPTVGSSRVPITFELLSPAGRPLQRTADLPGFWRGSYASVRAEMRGRYPKHPWPERPWEPLPPRRRPRP